MLRARGLTMRYPDGKVALADFDLSIEAGELVVVLGGNGSGKTTLLRCISRMLSPTAGEIWLNDTNLAVLSGERLRQARLPLAMIWQHASLVRRRSVLSNVAAGALGRHGGLWTALGGLPAVERRAAYDHLSAVGLAVLAGHAPAPCPAGRRSASQSPVRSPSALRCCSPTSRWRASTPKQPTTSCACCAISLRASTSLCCACCTRSSWPMRMPTASSAFATAGSLSIGLAPSCRATRLRQLYLNEAA